MYSWANIGCVDYERLAEKMSYSQCKKLYVLVVFIRPGFQVSTFSQGDQLKKLHGAAFIFLSLALISYWMSWSAGAVGFAILGLCLEAAAWIVS